MGTLKLREARGPQKDTWGGGAGKKAEARGWQSIPRPHTHTQFHLGGLCMTEVEDYLSQLLNVQGESAHSFNPPPPTTTTTSVSSSFQGKAVPNTDSPKL